MASVERDGQYGIYTVSSEKKRSSQLWRFEMCRAILIIIKIMIIKLIKRQFIRRGNMARVTTRVPYDVRCSYSANQLVSEVGTREKMS